MGEQSTSVWAVEPEWTGQVEQNGTQEVDLAAIKARHFPQQPVSPSVDMPPKTRSQTARSRPLNPPSLPTLQEDMRNLGMEDEETTPSPVQPSSPDYDPAEAERQAQGIVTHTTPKHRKITPTVSSSQRGGARDADPNKGRCFLTNRANAVQLCHLVARATKDEILTKLECVWEIGYRQLHVDTKRNLMFLRSDWHFAFDEEQWILVPEYEVLQKLSKIYLEDKRVTSDMSKLFVDPTYRYYVLPTPALGDPICRFPDIGSRDHQTHFPPFSDLDLLEGHFHPHFVIFNTGQKLRNLDPLEMGFLLRQIVPPSNDAFAMLYDIQRLYAAWTGVRVPDHYCNTSGPSNRLNPPSEERHDDRSPGGPARRQGLRSATRSQGGGGRSLGGRYDGGQQRADLPFQDDDASSITDGTMFDDDTDWIEYIHNWQKQGEGATEPWTSDTLDDARDKQLAAYVDEHARTPPTPGAWHSWRPTWDRKARHPSLSDRSQFSSNDWAVFKSDVYLTGSGHPQVTS